MLSPSFWRVCACLLRGLWGGVLNAAIANVYYTCDKHLPVPGFYCLLLVVRLYRTGVVYNI